MDTPNDTRSIAFENHRRIAAGPLHDVALAVKEVVDGGDHGTILVFADPSSQPIELDLRGTADDVARRLRDTAGGGPRETAERAEAAKPRGPGRPKLGVVGREVTLLPRHWQWLNSQPGGASVTLRKLVEEARRANAAGDRRRLAREATYRFLSALAGNLPGFEEATRALFAGDAERFDQHTAAWPADLRAHARKLAAPSFGS